MSEREYGRRFFRALSDKALLEWRPQSPRGTFGWAGSTDCSNISACNREIRRRAKLGRFDGPTDWIAKMRATYATSADAFGWHPVLLPRDLHADAVTAGIIASDDANWASINSIPRL